MLSNNGSALLQVYDAVKNELMLELHDYTISCHGDDDKTAFQLDGYVNRLILHDEEHFRKVRLYLE